jgi:outer membrane protein assembly factor BamB
MYISKYLLIVFLLVPIWLSAQNIAQWRGPDRNGIYPETDLLNEWPEEGPEQLWTTDGIGKGYSSVSVLEGTIYATGLNDSVETLTAINYTDGNILWQIPYGQSILRSFKDTRCTPTIEGNRAFMISGRGEVVCVDLSLQQIAWHVDAFQLFEGKSGRWEIAESPLLVEDKVIFTPGGHKTTMIALDKNTGETIWSSETLHDSCAYVSPILVERGDKKIIINVLSHNIIGVDVENGNILWTHKYPEVEEPLRYELSNHINTVTPIYKNGRLFITSGYDRPSAMFELSADGTKINLVWKQPVMDTHHGGVVLHDGYLYGSTWINNSQGNWACVDWDSGDLMYEKKWNNKGSIISADDKFIIYEEKRGFVGLVNPNPEDFKVISSFRHQQGSGPNWAHPVINNGILYIRHGETLSAYQISK